MRRFKLRNRQCLIAKPSLSPFRTNLLGYRSYGQKKDSANIPLEGGPNTIPFQNLEGSTITPKERDVFQRLFQNILHDASTKKPGLQRSRQKADTRKDAGSQMKSREQLMDSVSRFPKPLRDLALSTAERIEQTTRQAVKEAEHAADNEIMALPPAVRQRAEAARAFQESEKSRLTGLIENANTDLGVWNILEDEMFSKIASLHLHDVVPATKKMPELEEPNAQKDDAATSSQLMTDISNFGVLYPAILNQAVSTWRERYPSSTMPLSILPRLNQSGRASYALGVSTSLFHQLIGYTWAVSGDFAQVCALLQEMDDSGIEFTDETFAIMSRIKRNWDTRSKQTSTKLELAAFRMSSVTKEFAKFCHWLDVIEERLNARALRQANQAIANHVV